MKHMQAAYEALIEKLREEIKDVAAEAEQEQANYMDSEQILMDFIYKHHGYRALLEVAKEIDVKLGKGINYEDYVECTYEEPKSSDLSIADLCATQREIHCLRAAEITTLDQLCAMTENQVLEIPNLGRKAFNNIREELRKHGRDFAK
jgi:DNA-directed RNA polymerase alpha subunit